MSRLVCLTHFQLGLVLSSIRLQHHCSSNSSINSNTNKVHGVYTNTSLSSLKLFSFSFSQLLNPSPASKTISTYNGSPSEFPKTPITIATADSNSSTLPKELLKNVKVLTCESTAPGRVCTVYLVGTTHGGSEESYGRVVEIISLLKPQVVFLEMDPSIFPFRLSPNSDNPSQYKCVFRAALEEALKCGARVVPGDRPLMITFWRLVERMSLWDHIKYQYLEMRYGVFKFGLGRKVLDEERELQISAYREVFVQEREQFMCCKLLEEASRSSSVVAVVEEVHLEGMQNYWKQPIKGEDLMEIPLSLAAVRSLAMMGIPIAMSALMLRKFK